jgi:hypothetical protein
MFAVLSALPTAFIAPYQVISINNNDNTPVRKPFVLTGTTEEYRLYDICIDEPACEAHPETRLLP